MLATLLSLLMHDAIAALTSTYRLPPDRWQMLAIPSSAAITVGELAENILPLDGLNRNWAVYAFDPADADYRGLTLADSLPPGEAFWIKHLGQAPIELRIPERAEPVAPGPGTCRESAGCFRHPLPSRLDGTSWIMFGSPFNQPLAVNDLVWTNTTDCPDGCTITQAAARGYTASRVWGFTGEGDSYTAYGPGDRVPPWHGFWLAVGASAEGTQPALEVTSRPHVDHRIREAHAALGNGINFGNALEAPLEGEWGLTLEAEHFDLVKSAGFDSIRLPIRWSAHAATEPPYTIDPEFFQRIDWAVEQAHRVGMPIVLNVHHYDELMLDPHRHGARFVAMWRQIAERYAAAPDTTLFELLNEPTGRFNEAPEMWNALAAQTIATIRKTNPERPIIVGPVGWNAIDHLDTLRLPDDPLLIVTVHFYEPMAFTHQGADWVSPRLPVGVDFDGARRRLGPGFEDWSWDTEWVFRDDGLQLTFLSQFAGFNLRLRDRASPSSLWLDLSNAHHFEVRCAPDGESQQAVTVATVESADARQTAREIDLSACETETTNLILKNLSPGASSIVLHEARYCSTGGCEAIVSTQAEALEARLATAQRWGVRHGRPIYLGEFGAFGAADLDARVDWTTTVRRAIGELGLSSAYWEFAAGFGVYDPEAERWRKPLLNALDP